MFSLFIFIIVNVMFYLFYLQVEPVFYLRTIKSYPNQFCVINYQQHYLEVVFKHVKTTVLRILTYSCIKCQIYTHYSEKLRNYSIMFVS